MTRKVVLNIFLLPEKQVEIAFALRMREAFLWCWRVLFSYCLHVIMLLCVHERTSCPEPDPIKIVKVDAAEDCCSACAAEPQCTIWIFNNKGANSACKLKGGSCPAWKTGTCKTTGVVPGFGPTPPPPPAPTPPRPDPTPGAPNIIMVLTDDQDLRLGSMLAMPYTMAQVLPGAVNMSNYFINTPVCCPSRTTLLSGRMEHNNKAESFQTSGSGMCMRMNTSQDLNPDYWKNSFVHRLYFDLDLVFRTCFSTHPRICST